jgi:RND superfamily putative drug exporter
MTVFLPALLMVFGRYWFFPFVPRHDDDVSHDKGVVGPGRPAGRPAPAGRVDHHLAGPAFAALFTTQLEADGLSTAEQFTTEVDSVQGRRCWPGTSRPAPACRSASSAPPPRATACSSWSAGCPAWRRRP